jgi:hypothetical protein
MPVSVATELRRIVVTGMGILSSLGIDAGPVPPDALDQIPRTSLCQVGDLAVTEALGNRLGSVQPKSRSFSYLQSKAPLMRRFCCGGKTPAGEGWLVYWSCHETGSCLRSVYPHARAKGEHGQNQSNFVRAPTWP